MTKFLLLTKYAGPEGVEPMTNWDPAEIEAHIAYLKDLNRQLIESGELIDGQALTGPDLAKVVTSDGTAPVVTDGPFPEVKELLAGYQLVDVESERRALEIAGLVSAAPGPGGKPLGQAIEVRQLMGPLPGTEL
ncbi:MAG TPA: YciI family protein [Kribbellaceae bacterium]|nr:YciI family protein [Kribbellaceae bacterium]